MANIVEILIRATSNAAKVLEETGEAADKTESVFFGLEDAAKGLGVGLAAIGAAGVAAFKFGERGAELTQTAESFDLLLEKVDATPGLFDRLTEAAGGTITAFELQSSVATLLAGAQGELATSLADATPQLLEIARAANKLNPSLGDTTFLFDSLATGIKRASPLILDNLGLTISVGQANEEYAKSLGLTVDQLDETQKKQALLNATIDAGEVLIDQVGGTVDSAADEFAILKTNIAEAADALAKRYAPAVTAVVKTINDAIDAQQFYGDALKKGIISQKQYEVALFLQSRGLTSLKQALDKGFISQSKYNLLTKQLGDDAFHLAVIYEQVTEALEDYDFMMQSANAELLEYSLRAPLATEDTIEFSNALALAQTEFGDIAEGADFAGIQIDGFGGTLETAEEKMARLNEEAARLIDENLARLAEPTVTEIRFELSDPDIASQVERLIDEIEFFQAGGTLVTQG
jgi:hypothetical protein